MQRRMLILFAVLLASAALPFANAEKQPQNAVHIAKVYSVGDLPVWSKDGKTFEPVILMSLLKEALGSDEWRWTHDKYEALTGKDGKSSITAVAVNEGIVVNASEIDHAEIVHVLERLRLRTN